MQMVAKQRTKAIAIRLFEGRGIWSIWPMAFFLNAGSLDNQPMKINTLKKLFSLLSFSVVLWSVLATSLAAELPFAEGENVKVEVILEHSQLNANQENWALFRFKLREGWHIYWLNPGDSGLKTQLTFDLPQGVQLDQLIFSAPERIETEGLVTFGYHDEAFVLASFKVTAADSAKFKAQAKWLECKQSCIPGEQDLTWTWPQQQSAESGEELQAQQRELFAKVRAELPAKKASFGTMTRAGAQGVWTADPSLDLSNVTRAQFFPLEADRVAYDQTQVFRPGEGQGLITLTIPFIDSANNSPLHGVLRLWDKQDLPLYTIESRWELQMPSSSPLQLSAQKVAGNSPQAVTSGGYLWLLGLAFCGGLILNVMPCVLPVLSLKIMHILKHRGGTEQKPLTSSLAYTFGVLVSFWILAGCLIFFRQAGEGLWGFQMKSVAVVCALMTIFLLIGLNLFGVFEMGLRLVGVDQKANHAQKSGLWSAFGSGSLATLAATPCTAPYMGAALAAALTLPIAQAMLIFTALGLGMASPFIVVGLFPKALAFLPKPGMWMVQFKQGMGFLLMGTVAYLFYVVVALVEDHDRILNIAFSLVMISFGAWVYGQWAHKGRVQGWLARGVALTCMGLAVWLMQPRVQNLVWVQYSETELDRYLKNGQPVFLDFTASWCLSCKANERRVLEPIETARLFQRYGVVPMKADYTRQDPAITKALQKLGRSSIPVYVVYDPREPQREMLLPEILNYSDIETAFSKLSQP
jgi:thiol:disulfide interchange protein